LEKAAGGVVVARSCTKWQGLFVDREQHPKCGLGSGFAHASLTWRITFEIRFTTFELPRNCFLSAEPIKDFDESQS
jgi:hypothetical protein